MCKLCNNSDPSWVRKGKTNSDSLELEEACKVVIDYTGMYPCNRRRRLIQLMLKTSKINHNIDKYICSILLCSRSTRKERNKAAGLIYSVTNEHSRDRDKDNVYNKSSIVRHNSTSKHITFRENTKTKYKTYILRIISKKIKICKTFTTLQKAETYRDNLLNQH